MVSQQCHILYNITSVLASKLWGSWATKVTWNGIITDVKIHKGQAEMIRNNCQSMLQASTVDDEVHTLCFLMC